MRAETDSAALRLPRFAVVMKVGPHSGMGLGDIAASKVDEERRLGVQYWGYSGTLCTPNRVHQFVSYVSSIQARPPSLLLIATTSPYASPVGHSMRYSADGVNFREFPGRVQLQGAQFAFVAQDLQPIGSDFMLDEYDVVGGKNDGKPLSIHLRQRVGKAFVRRASRIDKASPARLAFVAQLVAPYAIWLET